MSLTTVTFESGTIADAMKKAGSVAPAKAGSAFDSAAGIVMDIAPGTEAPCVVRATDTEVFFIETLDVISAVGDPVRWRLPSQLLANVIGSQAAGTGKTIKFEQMPTGQIKVSSSSMRATINVNGNPNYPTWSPLSSVDFTMAPSFGESVSRVIWAAEKGGLPLLSGFHLDGEFVVATDRYRVARYPMPLPDLKEPITIPAGRIGALLRGTGDILVGVQDDIFVMMPDDYTEIRTVVYGSPYVPVKNIFGIQYTNQMQFSRQDLVERVQRATHFAGSDRAPVLYLYVGRSQLAIMMQNREVGQYGDVIDVPGQAEHDRITLRFTPAMVLDALSNSPSDGITLHYNPAATNKPVKMSGGGGYECWLAPRSEITPTE